MRKIYKYALPFRLALSDHLTLDLPKRFTIVHAAATGEAVTLWVEFVAVEPLALEPVEFTVHETGHPIPDDRVHVFTWDDPPFVWHLYRATPAF